MMTSNITTVNLAIRVDETALDKALFLIFTS